MVTTVMAYRFRKEIKITPNETLNDVFYRIADAEKILLLYDVCLAFLDFIEIAPCDFDKEIREFTQKEIKEIRFIIPCDLDMQDGTRRLGRYLFMRNEHGNIEAQNSATGEIIACDYYTERAIDQVVIYEKSKLSEEFKRMKKENLHAKLYDKAYQEQEDYITHLKTLSPKEIIENAYEKVIRDDILLIFESNDGLSLEQIKALLQLEYPLASCYHEWLNNDSSHMEILKDTVAEFSQTLVDEQQQ